MSSYRVVGNLLASCGDIPSGANELEIWIAAALAKVANSTNRKVKSRAALTTRLQTMVRIIRQIENRPVVFRRWLEVPAVANSRVAAHKRASRLEFSEGTSHAPYEKSEVIRILDNCRSFAEALSVLNYLTGGFRAGEGECAQLHHIGHDGLLNLNEIVTKTKGRAIAQRRPRPSVLLRAALAWFAAHPQESRAVPKNVQRQRFRPSAAVHLLLSGVTQMEVMERLGHATLAMITNHYAKLVPLEFGRAKSSAHYFGVSQLSIDGHEVPGNKWDWFLLIQALEAAKRWGVSDFRSRVVELVKPKGNEEDAGSVVSL